MIYSKRKYMGTTLMEVLISTGAFSVVLMTLFVVVNIGTKAWKQAESKGNAQTVLRKAEIHLLDDLRRAKAGNNIKKAYIVPKDGKEAHMCLWFLSALGRDSSTTSDLFSRTTSGEPMWKRTVLYYVAAPTSDFHKEEFGFECPSEKVCPHKWLIRKEIVYPGRNESVGSDSEGYRKFVNAEEMSKDQISDYVVAPESFRCLANALSPSENINSDEWFAKPGCKRVISLGDCIQFFDVSFPNGTKLSDNVEAYGYSEDTSVRRGINICLRAFRFDEASREVGLNNNTLNESNFTFKLDPTSKEYKQLQNRYTMQYNINIIPNN